MPSIITTAHQKGGVGKSTIALNLYGYFSQAGIPTAIVDIDPQGSITSFVEFSGAENSISYAEPILRVTRNYWIRSSNTKSL